MKMKLIAAGFAAALALVPAASARPHHASHGGGQLLAAAATYLGLDKATVVADLRAGQSLAQIATSKGKTADGLVAALLAPAKLKLDAAVAAGRITATQEAAVLARLQAGLTNLVNRVSTPRPATEARIHIGPAAILQPALAYLGLDLKGVVAQLRSGKTLAQIAVAQNKTAQGLVDAVVASVKTKLDAQVAAGKLTSAQETSFLTTLQTNVTAFVNGAH